MMMKMNGDKSNRFVDSLFSKAIIMLPILYQYRGVVAQISLGETILIPFILYYLAGQFRNNVLIMDKREIYFYVPIIIISSLNLICAYYSFADSFTVIVRIIYYLILIIVAKDHFQFDGVEHFYFRLVELCTLYLFVQYIFTMITGNYLPIYLSRDLVNSTETIAENLETYYRWSFRSSSTFLEQSHYALFCLQYLCFKPYPTGNR